MSQQENTIKITIPEEQLWENLKISNDFMFAKVMRNPELCKGMLERLLDIQIDHIEYPEEQKVIDISKDSKSVRLDVLRLCNAYSSVLVWVFICSSRVKYFCWYLSISISGRTESH